eukprot:6508537-Pyramimonas_sp.AAC.1
MISEGLDALVRCMEPVVCQSSRGKYIAFEHPYFATSWMAEVVRLAAQIPGAQMLRIGICTYELFAHPDGVSKEPTGILTSRPGMSLQGRICMGGHRHATLENQLPRRAQ